jgi:hypothetical protein
MKNTLRATSSILHVLFGRRPGQSSSFWKHNGGGGGEKERERTREREKKTERKIERDNEREREKGRHGREL